MTTTNDAVQNIANTLAEMERKAHANVRDARQTRDDFKAISENGDASPLLTSKHHAALVAISTDYAASLLDLHYRMTEDAKALGIDIPDAQETPGDDIGILSGGGR